MVKKRRKHRIERCRQCYVMIVINGKREPDSIGSLCADCLWCEYGFETDLDREINKMEFELTPEDYKIFKELYSGDDEDGDLDEEDWP